METFKLGDIVTVAGEEGYGLITDYQDYHFTDPDRTVRYFIVALGEEIACWHPGELTKVSSINMEPGVIPTAADVESVIGEDEVRAAEPPEEVKA